MRRINTTLAVALLATASIATPALADAPDGPFTSRWETRLQPDQSQITTT